MGAINISGLPMDVLRTAQGKVNQSRPNGRIGDLVHQNEPTQFAIIGIGRKRNCAVGGDCGHANRIQVQCFDRRMFQSIHVDLILWLRHGCGYSLCPDL